MILIMHFPWNFFSHAVFLLTNLWTVDSIRNSSRACIESMGDHRISGVVFMVMPGYWTIDHRPSIQSNLFVKMAGTTRQVPLQMLNHRAGLTTHPSIDFFVAHMTAEKPENNLPAVRSLALHRLGCAGERAPFLFSLVPSAAGSITTLPEGGVGHSLWCRVRVWKNLSKLSTLGLSLRENSWSKKTVLGKSAKCLTPLCKSHLGIRSNNHGKPLNSVYFHPPCRDSRVVSP